MATVWNIADKIRTVGVVTTLHFDPSQLTVRIRKAAQRMLRVGMLHGGWSSQSRKVAELVATHHRLPMISVRGTYVSVARSTLDDQDVAEIRRLVQADLAAHQLAAEIPRYYIEQGRARDYIDMQVSHYLTYLTRFETGDVDYLNFIDPAFANHLGTYLMAKYDNEPKRELAAAYLDSSQCIPLPSYF